MRKHTDRFKECIKTMGRQLDSIITYTRGEEEEKVTIRNEELNEVSPLFEGALLKSIMRELDIDSNVDIPIDTVINYKLGVRLEDEEEFEYLDFGNYIVYSSEKQEDTESYKIVAYDNMLNAMIPYTSEGLAFPMTVREFLITICDELGLTFKNREEEFANYDKIIDRELYLDQDGNDLGYTFRDVLDELAQVTASNIVINEKGELEIKYINMTDDEIDGEFLKDINVKFGEKYGKINSIVLSRSAESDNVFLQDEESVTQNGLCEIKIIDNQIMNFNNRDEFLPDILEKLNGVEFYLNDFSSTGVCYYELGDMYNINIDGTIYNCLMLNDKITVTQGLEESIHTDRPEEAQTDYTKADKTDRRLNQTYLLVNKQEQNIEALISQTDGINEQITQIYQDIDNIINRVQKSGGNNLIKNSVMFAYDNDGIPSDWEVDKGYKLVDFWKVNDTQTKSGVTLTNNNDGTFNLKGTNTSADTIFFTLPVNYVDTNLTQGKQYTLSSKEILPDGIGAFIEEWGASSEYIKRLSSVLNATRMPVEITLNMDNTQDRIVFVTEVGGNKIVDAENLKVELIGEEANPSGKLIINSSSEALNNGSLSGHVFTLKNTTVKQRVNVKKDDEDIPEEEKTYYTFSTKIKKNAVGTCYVKIYNSNEEYTIQLENGQESFYGNYELKALLPKDNYYDIEFYGSEDSDATFTDNMFAVGQYSSQWTQADGEIMNTQVNINVNGILVKSSVYQGDYTVMSPLEFAGYSNVNGTITKVFSLNKDVTLVKKLEAEDEIKMIPIKIVPILEGENAGWHFVKST